jgi:hypothetical protein
MSSTYLHLVDRQTILATASLIDTFRSSRTAFEEYVDAYWGGVRYAYEDFLEDNERKHDPGGGIYYLAHAILINRKEITSTFMNVELGPFFLDCFELAEPPADSAIGAEAQKLFAARRAAGSFRIGTPPSGHRTFTIGKPEDVETLAEAHGLPPQFAQDVILLDRLCNWQKPRAPSAAETFPLWIVAGWDNYEGYLTGGEIASFSSLQEPGFFSAFNDALPADSPFARGVMELLFEVREQALVLGPDSLCIAVSSL